MQTKSQTKSKNSQTTGNKEQKKEIFSANTCFLKTQSVCGKHKAA